MANIPIWPGSSSFALSANPTPFGFYDQDPEFRKDIDNVASWTATRLGYPLIDIELQDINFYTCFEEAINEYGAQVYNKPLILDKMEKEETIELVSLAHFRGRTFDNSVVIVDEFQNLTRSQLAMAIGRLAKDSKMIFCGDSYQIDLKDKNYSAYHDMAKLINSQYVFKCVLEDSHRHDAIDDLLELLNGYH